MDISLTDFHDLPSDAIPSAIAQLSYESHLEDVNALEVELSDHQSVLDAGENPNLFTIDVERNLLQFVNAEAKKHCAAMHLFRVYSKSSPVWDAEKLFDELYKVWVHEHHGRDTVAGRFLGLLSSSDANVFGLSQEAIKGKDSHRVYVVFSCLGSSFSFMRELPLQGLLELLEAQYNLEHRDQSVPVFYSKISDFLSEKLPVAQQLAELIRRDLSEAKVRLYVSCMEAFTKAGELTKAINYALEDLKSDKHLSKRAAMLIFGQLIKHWEVVPELRKEIQTLIINTCDHSEDEIKRTSLNVLSRAASTQHELIPELVKRAVENNQNALHALKDFVCMNEKVIAELSDLSNVLDPLIFLTAENTDLLDYSLSGLIKAEKHFEAIEDWLTQWATRNCTSLDSEDRLSRSFQQSITELYTKERLFKLLTDWALADEKGLGVAFADVISELWVRGIKNPVFHKLTIDSLNQDDFKYLARRMLGWIFHEEALLSLTFSLLDTDNALNRSFGWVHELLTNDIGKNYPRATLQEIENRLTTSTGNENKLLRSAHTKLSKYIDALDKLPRLNELRPPEMLQRHITFKKNKQQREGQEAAQKHSLLTQLCTHIPLKNGNGWFSIRDGKIGEIGRLSTHSFQGTLPVGAVMDPVNDTITRLGYRTAKRGDE